MVIFGGVTAADRTVDDRDTRAMLFYLFQIGIKFRIRYSYKDLVLQQIITNNSTTFVQCNVYEMHVCVYDASNQ